MNHPQNLNSIKQQFGIAPAYQSCHTAVAEGYVFEGHIIAMAVNGSVPAPILRWREGDRVTLRVTNHLTHDSSIHCHGMILPTE